MNFGDCFERIYVLNLPERTDRRAHAQRALAAAGLLARGNVTFFPAIRPASADGFPSIGAHGCFLSHLAVIREALATDAERVLVLEDDATFTPRFSNGSAQLVQAAASSEWDILYLGHDGVDAAPAPGSAVVPYDGPVRHLVAYALSRSVMPRLRDYLEAVLTRAPGDPLGGPMHVDGAFTMFRAAQRDVRTWVCIPPAVTQSSFSSDITPGLLDRTPVLSTAVGLARRLRRRLS